MKRNRRQQDRIDAAALFGAHIIIATLMLITSTIAVVAYLQLEKLT